MRAEICGSEISGTVTAPPSKSACHRSIICAMLSDRPVIISNCGFSNDINATLSAVQALGGKVRRDGSSVTVTPPEKAPKNAIIDCRESGSTARFLIPVAAALGGRNITFTGSGRLPKRPFSAITEALTAGGISCPSDHLPITVSGKLKAGAFCLPGDISSQYLSGLLMALSVTVGDSMIQLTTPLQSAPYVDMTVNELRLFGACIEKTDEGYKISGKPCLSGCDRTVEGDWSQAAFFFCAGAMTGSITVKGLKSDSLQGDRRILEILREFGADIALSDSAITVRKALLHGITVDASDIPDLVPVLAALAASASGRTVIKGAERLRLKESDRLSETVRRLGAFGIIAEETHDGMIITGSVPHSAGITSAGDHRIVMAFSVLAAACCGTSVIDGAEAVNKSYPEFFEDFMKVGGRCHVIGDR